MTGVTELIGALAEELAGASSLAGCVVAVGYPAASAPLLSAPEIRVYLRSAEDQNKAMGGELGRHNQSQAAVKGRVVLLSIGFSVFVPAAQGGEALSQLAERVFSHLLLDSDMNFAAVQWGGVTCDKPSGSLCTEITAGLSAVIESV